MLQFSSWRRWAALLSLLLLTACAAHDATVPGSADAVEGGLAGLPQDPQLSYADLLRQGSLLSSIDLYSGAAIDSSPGLEFESSHRSVDLTAGPQGIGWLMYSFGPLNPFASPDSFAVEVSTFAAKGTLYAAVSNYDANRWDIYPLDFVNGRAMLPVDRSVEHASASGNVYLALIVHGEASHEIKGLRLTLDEALPAPVGLTATVRSDNEGIVLNWVDPAVSFDPDGEGPLTYDYGSVFVYRADGPQRSFNLVRSFNAMNRTDTWTDDVEPGQEYYYKISLGGRRSPAVTGIRGTQPVPAFHVNPLGESGPQIVRFNPDTSYDPDGGSLSTYEWDLDADGHPDLTNTHEDAVEVTYDLDQPHEVGLRVSDEFGHTSPWLYKGFGTPAPGLLQDPLQPQPYETIDGTLGSYTVDLHFLITYGNPNYKIELDTEFDTDFGNSPNKLPVILLKDFGTAPNVKGSYTFTDVPLPPTQAPGMYEFALRVTDSTPGAEPRVLVWPNTVQLP